MDERLDDNRPRVNIITKRMSHHAKGSGYDRLADYLDGNRIEPVSQWGIGQSVVARVLKPFVKNSGTRWYQRDCMMAELSAAGQWINGNNQIFHFLYGENSYRYLGKLKSIKKGNKIIGTFHTPPDKFEDVVTERSHMKALDGIVVVSTMQQEYFSRFVTPERVFYVPHGIDVEAYQPNAAIKCQQDSGATRCLFVGSHLRDLETLSAASKILETRLPQLHFTVVTSTSYQHYLNGLTNIDFQTGIAAEALLQLYQTADIFVMPLLECTANNGLLEAMASGMPIVSTDLQGVRDYVNNDCAVLTPKQDVDSLADVLIELAANQSKREAMAVASREKALEFRWENVADEMNRIYQQLM